MINALRFALTAVTVATVPAISGAVSTSMSVESSSQPKTSTTGIVRALMTTEPGASGSSTLGFVLDTGASKIELPTDETTPSAVGTRLTLAGGRESIENGEAVVTASVAAVTNTYSPLASRNLLVVPVTWEGVSFTTERLAELQSTLTALDSWWSSASSGIEDLSVTTLPITTIPVQTECDYKALETAARAAAAGAGLANWATNVSVVLPRGSTCWWGGLGYLPGFTTWINAIDLRVFIHELGHNMGLPHANRCFTNETMSVNNSCQELEYGDPTDPMGITWSVDRYSFGAEYLSRIGWLKQSQQTSWAGTTASYSLIPIDVTNQPGLRGVRISARGSLDNNAPGDYWLQYRVFSGYRGSQSGVHLTVSPTREFELNATGKNSVYPPATWLCDLTPGDLPWGTPGADSFGFPLNVPWTDPTGLFTITVTAATSELASLTITPTGQLPSPPAAVIAEPLITDSLPDGRIKVSWTASPFVPVSGLAESVVVTATIDGTTNSCTAHVRSKSCIISGAPRGRELNISSVGRNYAGTSSASISRVAAIPVTPPMGLLKPSSTSTSATVTLEVTDTGGAPVLSTGVIALSNGQTCPVGTVTCNFRGLLPRNSYSASTTLENSAGARRIVGSISTLSQKPTAPTVTARLADGVPTVSVAVAAIDAHNVDSISIYCRKTEAWRRVPYQGTPVVTELPSVGTDDHCFIFAFNTVGYSTSVFVGISSLSDKPTTIPGNEDEPANVVKPAPVISAKAVRLSGGNRVRVTWKVTNGNNSQVTVSKIAGRTCKRITSNSCVATRVPRGRMRVVLSAPRAARITLRTPR